MASRVRASSPRIVQRNTLEEPRTAESGAQAMALAALNRTRPPESWIARRSVTSRGIRPPGICALGGRDPHAAGASTSASPSVEDDLVLWAGRPCRLQHPIAASPTGRNADDDLVFHVTGVAFLDAVQQTWEQRLHRRIQRPSTRPARGSSADFPRIDWVETGGPENRLRKT